MRSDIYKLESLASDYREIPAEADKVAGYNRLDRRSALRLRLLAEEMICMLPQLIIYGKGSFWIENEGKSYELHLDVEPYDMSEADKGKIIAVSKSGKNAAAVGIIGRICDAVETMLLERARLAKDDPYRAAAAGMLSYSDSTAWSLIDYRDSFSSKAKKQNEPEAWDELEKSILANIADDIIVGVRGGRVSIVVKKVF